jgi:hypothetical protein
MKENKKAITIANKDIPTLPEKNATVHEKARTCRMALALTFDQTEGLRRGKS